MSKYTIDKNQSIEVKSKISLNFTKLIIGWLILNGTAWIWCSYYLAYIGKEAIAEQLSTTVVIEIIGVVAVYSAKALFENLSKHNKWPDRDRSYAKRDYFNSPSIDSLDVISYDEEVGDTIVPIGDDEKNIS